MSSTTVAEFASELKKSTETLLDQLKSAGVVKKSPSDVLTDADKHSLLNYLQSSHGTAGGDRKKITLVKKQTTEIKQADASGKARTIQVEVRKKRTFVRREDGMDAVPEGSEAPVVEAASSAPVIDDAELIRREEEARHQAEFIRRQEEELAARRKEREEQEAKTRAAHEKAAAEAQALQAEVSKRATKSTKAVATDAVVDATPEAESAEQAAQAAQAAKQAREDALETAANASKAAAAEESKRASELGDRRRKAEAEAAAIRLMMATPNKVAVPPKKVEPAVDPKAAIKGTLHKPATGSTVAKPGGTAGAATGAGAGQEV